MFCRHSKYPRATITEDTVCSPTRSRWCRVRKLHPRLVTTFPVAEAPNRGELSRCDSISRKCSIPRESPGRLAGRMDRRKSAEIADLDRDSRNRRHAKKFPPSYRCIRSYNIWRGEVEARAALYAPWKGMSKCQMHFHSVLQLTKEVSNCEYEKIEYLYMCRCVCITTLLVSLHSKNM